MNRDAQPRASARYPAEYREAILAAASGEFLPAVTLSGLSELHSLRFAFGKCIRGMIKDGMLEPHEAPIVRVTLATCKLQLCARPSALIGQMLIGRRAALTPDRVGEAIDPQAAGWDLVREEFARAAEAYREAEAETESKGTPEEKAK